jgi:L-lactate dehydrogenase complex protein LldF
MHRTREQVSEMFKKAHRVPHKEETIEAMVDSARRELRDKFLSADVSISGANFLIADTGATCTVTNEGNAELTTSPPRMHIVTAGIEKLVPSLPHAFALLRLLVRSATGADVTQYTTFHCGPKKPGDLDGPEEFHIVLVDNGRTKMLADAGLRDMLRCLRCGACMNHCVVFQAVGRPCLRRRLPRADGSRAHAGVRRPERVP